MMGIAIFVMVWFGLGALGVMLAYSRMRQLFPASRWDDDDTITASITIIAGPAGLIGGFLFWAFP